MRKYLYQLIDVLNARVVTLEAQLRQAQGQAYLDEDKSPLYTCDIGTRLRVNGRYYTLAAIDRTACRYTLEGP